MWRSTGAGWQGARRRRESSSGAGAEPRGRSRARRGWTCDRRRAVAAATDAAVSADLRWNLQNASMKVVRRAGRRDGVGRRLEGATERATAGAGTTVTFAWPAAGSELACGSGPRNAHVLAIGAQPACHRPSAAEERRAVYRRQSHSCSTWQLAPPGAPAGPPYSLRAGDSAILGCIAADPWATAPRHPRKVALLSAGFPQETRSRAELAN